jgi:hypothetical protein
VQKHPTSKAANHLPLIKKAKRTTAFCVSLPSKETALSYPADIPFTILLALRDLWGAPGTTMSFHAH